MKHQGLPFALAVSLLLHIVIASVAMILMAAPNLMLPERIVVDLIDIGQLERSEKTVALVAKRPVVEARVKPPQLLEKTDMAKSEPEEVRPSVIGQSSPPPLEITKASPVEPGPSAGEQRLTANRPSGAGDPGKGGSAGREAKGEAAGDTAGTGVLGDKGDVALVPGAGGAGGRGGEGDGSVRTARPSAIHQVKPRYPDSARQAGAQGVTLLRVKVLENGLVDEVLVEKSAGFPDLDIAAAEGVKKWRFSPARRGKDPIAVWVLLPVRFELR